MNPAKIVCKKCAMQKIVLEITEDEKILLFENRWKRGWIICASDPCDYAKPTKKERSYFLHQINNISLRKKSRGVPDRCPFILEHMMSEKG